MILGGIVLSIFILIFEYFYYKKKPEKAGTTTAEPVPTGELTDQQKIEAFDRFRHQYSLNPDPEAHDAGLKDFSTRNGVVTTELNGGAFLRNGVTRSSYSTAFTNSAYEFEPQT